MFQFQTKKDMIYETLKREIYDSKFQLGEKLVISRLAKRFSCSEIPVREAMNQLNTEGLIEFKPHVGAIVSTLSVNDIQDIFELRAKLEAFATSLAVDQLEEEDLCELRDILDESIAAFENKAFERFKELNIEFHMKIYNKCNNQLLIKTIEDLWNNSNRYPSLFKNNEQHIELSIQEHEDIFKALVDRNHLTAEEYMMKHKDRAKREVLKLAQSDLNKV